MTTDALLLLCLLFLPLVGAIIVALLGPDRGPLIRWISLATSIGTLALALLLTGRLMSLDRTPPSGSTLPTFRPEFVPGSTADDPHHTTWDILNFTHGRIQFYLGLDGLNVWMVLLTAVLMLPSVLISWNHIRERVNEYYAWLLTLQTCIMGIFMAFDIVMFYVFFELQLVPLFFLIGIWGGPLREYAARKFFIYTLAGSMLTLLGVLGVVIACYTTQNELSFSIPRLVELVHLQVNSPDPNVRSYWHWVQLWVFYAMVAGFAIKVPLVPFHTWLPLAHVEAPTAGSVDLAGVLLKVGAYGFLRLCIPLAPDISLAHGLPLITILATIGIVYGSFCAYGQNDVKRMIAYSSVSHLGLCMLGMFTLGIVGLSGSMMQMINHGLSTGALFLMIGMIYERYHTRKITDYSGMAAKMPLFATLFVFVCLTSVGLPGLNGFVGEILCLGGIFQLEWQFEHKLVLGIIAFSGVILGAWYLFTMLRHILFGPLREPEHHGEPIRDLDGREVALLAPILLLCVLIGFYPQPILDTSRGDLQTVADIAQSARKRASPVTTAENELTTETQRHREDKDRENN
jgi:NADH-quinone oxidoreductase subunit M